MGVILVMPLTPLTFAVCLSMNNCVPQSCVITNEAVFMDMLILGLRINLLFNIMQRSFSTEVFTHAIFLLKVTFTEIAVYAKESLLNYSPLHCAYKGNEEADECFC